MLEPRWVEVIDEDGEHLGWSTEEQCQFLDNEVFEAEIPERFLEDPWIIYHFDLAHSMGRLQGDLNAVQTVALQSYRIRDAKRRNELREIDFERQVLLTHGPETAEEWSRARRKAMATDNDQSFRWEAPPSADELAADLKALMEEDTDWDAEEDLPYSPDQVDGMSE